MPRPAPNTQREPQRGQWDSWFVGLEERATELLRSAPRRAARPLVPAIENPSVTPTRTGLDRGKESRPIP